MPEQQADGVSAPSALELRSQLMALLAILDEAGEAMAAAYVQMAIDVLGENPLGDNA